MRAHFEACAEALDRLIRPDEHYLARFEGEASDFVRFNRGAVRHAGSVRQMLMDLSVIRGERRAASRVALCGATDIDREALAGALATLRACLAEIPPDPYLLYNQTATQTVRVRAGASPGAAEIVASVCTAASGLDLVGFYAGGPIARGFASSFGSRRWHETQSFNFDFSLHANSGAAVKSRYAGFDWCADALSQTIAAARSQLELLARPSRALSPGAYRAYLAPAAMAELVGLLGWDGFGIKAQRTRASPLNALVEGAKSLSPLVSLSENIAGGVAADFDALGFEKPQRIPLIVAGKHAGSLVSPRSAREYGVETTGAMPEEFPEALDLAPGEMPAADALERLGAGVYINNLWYLNYSDRPAGRMTGMTRFATYWVEGGAIVAPVSAMRFDDSVYRLLGENLEALTRETQYLIDTDAYGARSTVSWRMPGAIINDLALTL